jgi:hypothetical protein
MIWAWPERADPGAPALRFGEHVISYGMLAAEARVDLVVVKRLPGQAAPRVVRRLPADLAEALVALAAGPRRPV